MKLNIQTLRITIAVAALTGSSALSAQTFNILLTGSQEVAPNMAGGAGYASLELSGTSLSYQINYQTSGPLTGAHFHGPAAAGVNASVAQGLTLSASPITGSISLTSGNISDLMAGNWYLNLHTGANPGGEIRGQVVNQLSFAPNTIISGLQEVGPVATKGGGAALVTYNPATNELAWDLAYEGLDSGVTGMHFHGPAAVGANAGVQVNIGAISGLASGGSGSAVISEAQEADLLGGLWYINVHTNNVGSGEIRGQVNPAIVPEPSTYAALFGLAALGIVGWRRRATRSAK